MGRYIAEFGGKYLVWSAVVDAPVTHLMDEAELMEYVGEQYGQEELDMLPERLALVARQGTSAQDGTTQSDLLDYNRAGPNESHLKTAAEIVARYTTPNAAPIV